jgi:hypothetical protein
MQPVNEMIERLVRNRGRFVGIEQGWGEFLHYLEARQGADIHGAPDVRFREITTRLDYVEEILEDPGTRDADSDNGLAEFGRRQDVIEAFRGFLDSIRDDNPALFARD